MTTPTTNAVPSAASQDLLFNAEMVDQIVNSVALSYADRFGVQRMTMAGAVETIKTINLRGAWATGATYAAKDVASNGGTWYICVAQHIAGATFAGDLAAYWRIYQGVTTADLLGTGPGQGAEMISVDGPTLAARFAWLDRLGLDIMVVIPEAEHAAILAYSSTYNAIDDINAAIAAAPIVRMPAGNFRATRPVNLGGRRNVSALYSGRALVGMGPDKTKLDAYTGVYAAIDIVGASNITVMGINIRSDNPPSGLGPSDCASIGILVRRGSASSLNEVAHDARLQDVRINLTSDMSRNSGAGTVGVINCGGEHLISDRVQVYANLPLAVHNVMQFAIAAASSMPTYGTQYEVPYSGSPISCTIMEWRSMQLIAYDSFRAMWLHQVAHIEFPALYTSTRYLVDLTPAQAESFYLSGSSSNVQIHCYQEVSGLFGATYRMDHRYLTLQGDHDGLEIRVQRGALDMGFTDPGVSASSVHLENAAYLANSDIDCNYLVGIYNASGDNNGFAALPVTFSGTPNALRNVTFTVDKSGAHTADIFSALGPYCTNVEAINYISGANYRGSAEGAVTPTAIGLSTAGTGTYTINAGTYARAGRMCHFAISIGWSAHTGTGSLAIAGLPFASDPNYEQAVSVYYDGLLGASGKQVIAYIPNNSSQILLRVADPAGGAAAAVAMDTSVTKLLITGSYRIA